MIKKWLTISSIVLMIFVLSACGEESAEKNNAEQESQKDESALENNKGEAEQPEKGQKPAEMPEVPKPDLDSIPDVVAQVNGEEITKEEFESTFVSQYQKAAMQAQLTGQEFDEEALKSQLVDALVGQELLVQEANKRGYTVSDDEMDAMMEKISEENGLQSKEEFFSILKQQGMGKEEVISQLKLQLKVDQLIEEEAGDINPTEKELKEAYDQYTAQQKKMGTEKEVPSYEEMKPDLVAQVKSQKQQEVTQTIMNDLREEADVTINL